MNTSEMIKMDNLKAKYGFAIESVQPDMNGWRVKLKPGYASSHLTGVYGGEHIFLYATSAKLMPWLDGIMLCNCGVCRERMVVAGLEGKTPAHYEEWLAKFKK